MNKQEIIRQILMKYTDPKPEFDGVNAWDIAGIILKQIQNCNEVYSFNLKFKEVRA